MVDCSLLVLKVEELARLSVVVSLAACLTEAKPSRSV